MFKQTLFPTTAGLGVGLGLARAQSPFRSYSGKNRFEVEGWVGKFPEFSPIVKSKNFNGVGSMEPATQHGYWKFPLATHTGSAEFKKTHWHRISQYQPAGNVNSIFAESSITPGSYVRVIGRVEYNVDKKTHVKYTSINAESVEVIKSKE
ncbi:hypothetical protein HDU98_002808 [Podochytrium sp. JEL0797]|nr:hypothetical protein HDU98_002808 [Podochytrium sp. JEL0797]